MVLLPRALLTRPRPQAAMRKTRGGGRDSTPADPVSLPPCAHPGRRTGRRRWLRRGKPAASTDSSRTPSNGTAERSSSPTVNTTSAPPLRPSALHHGRSIATGRNSLTCGNVREVGNERDRGGASTPADPVNPQVSDFRRKPASRRFEPQGSDRRSRASSQGPDSSCRTGSIRGRGRPRVRRPFWPDHPRGHAGGAEVRSCQGYIRAIDELPRHHCDDAEVRRRLRRCRPVGRGPTQK